MSPAAVRIMGLDPGSKRVGVALSDGLGITAQGLTVLNRKPHAEFMARVRDLAEEHHVTRIVVGLPRSMDGSLGPEAQRALSLVNELKKHLSVEIVTWDERLSTAAAERALLEANVRRDRRKQVVDKVAAALILQSYLDSRGSSPPEAN